MENHRDYSKFLDSDGKLNIRVIPRPVYTAMVNQYRRDDSVIRDVFGELFWLWDLEELERKAREAGEEPDTPELAQEVLNSMDDKDWWQVMSRFEQHFNRQFPNDPHAWSEHLDPVYDDQEKAGWTRRQ